ncbi:MAG: BspA family leucine-rich repeat surface protein [Methanobrevibacter sp.]|uniref:BspA family leucine-rich repeat surface protein n=1 Tax=Methanobrevibacter sp. TaxID=66852 RepID=UPI001B6620C1|nr:BspA family leucine-rich repeat surface protein [Methanobrevibacter sp.]MBP3792276.1 BspA family leucine-rich repeat surface protein [Methanobrevibacter sp.]
MGMAKIHLYDFEHLNTTTESIYELGDFNLLIVLKDGKNLTSWADVKNREDIIFISEDLFGQTSLEARYKGMKNLRAIVTFGVGNVESLKELFSGCESLEDISTLASWDVSGVTDTSFMFNGCTNLADISCLSRWNTSNVTSISRMFSGCESLEDISPLKNWDVGNVRDMYYLFSYCSSLKDISALEYWDVSNVLDMGCAFDFCISLEDISPLENWDLSNVFNMTALFRGCVSLKDISPLGKWDLSKMTRNKALLAIFSYCTNLRNISPLKKWDVSNITRMSGLFEGCTSLRDASPLRKWDVSNVTSLEFMFRECSSLTDITNFKSWNIENVDSLTGMLDSCRDLEDVSPMKKLDVSNVKSMNKLFYNCSSLTDVSSLKDWKISEEASIKGIFDKCELLEEYPEWFKMTVMNNNDADITTRKKIINSLDEEFFKTHDLNQFDDDTQLFMVAATDSQALLAHICERSHNRFIQEKAVERITDEEILTNIVLNDHNCDISRQNGELKSYFYNREIAILKIKNKAFLIKIAKQLPHILQNFKYIAKYIDTDEEWTDIVLNAKSQHIRVFALANVKSANYFERIISESDDEQLVKVAKLNMPGGKPIEDE